MKKIGINNIEEILRDALRLCQLNRLGEAKILYVDLLVKFPNNIQALTNLGTIEIQTGNISSGVDLLKKSLKIDCQQNEALANLANGLIELGDYKTSIEYFQEAIKLSPRNPENFYNLGRGYKGIHKYSEAIDSYDKAIALNSSNPLFYNNRGHIFYLDKKYNESIDDFNKAISLFPNTAEFHFNRGLAFHALKLMEKSIRDFSQAISINSNYIDAFKNRILIYEEMHLYNEAKLDYEAIIKINPDNYENYLEKANFLGVIGEYNEAIEIYNFLLTKDAKNKWVFYNRAITYGKLDDFKKAIADYKESENLGLQTETLFNNLGSAFNSLERYDEAFECYQKAIKINPKYADAYFNYGITYNATKKFDLAINSFIKAIKLNPEYALAFNNIGVTYNALRQYDSAANSYNRAIELLPEYIEALNNRANNFSDQAKYEEALVDYKKVFSINKNCAAARYNASLTHLNLKNFKEGWELYESRFDNSIYKNENRLLESRKRLLSFGVKNKKILIFGEQGLGDQIIYLTMLKDAISNSSNIFTVFIDERLIPLYERSFQGIKFVSKKADLDTIHFDFYLHSGSLGAFFRNSIEDFKFNLNYLMPDKDRTKVLREKLTLKNKKICGISWKSQNPNIGHNKSLTLNDLMPLFQIPEFIFVDLQYGDNWQEKDLLRRTFGIEILSVEEIDNYNDIDGLASLINACDFIVTPSNVTAHIAGSINKDTFVTLPHAQGKLWYWHYGDQKNLWYPSVIQYRQEKDGDWSYPISKIKKDVLNKYL
jgi:tetratricopeptide (TPR) repeat protein